ncbi:3-deoxy-manno-octulosonate cytidylyltransferase [Methylotetracoccus oryzae]|uniref:3-deoxy-manno-octulosonate cytidylyltransferase n=1 Tax=Methylotetracoccus oryzae TaxID=1919059 RepID=UPI00111A5666|nr:3-deoxy-manno-octulosonate cytidylyltransferase [Methylotetracoccus oryzae]
MNSPAPFKIVIPARLGSSRLPGKVLIPIAGKPMIVHVCERAIAAGAAEVIVAADDRSIGEAIAPLRVTTVLTSPRHSSGTERLAEVAERLAWDAEERIVNLQGDEPLVDPALIRILAEALLPPTPTAVATLATAIDDPSEIFNPNAVKVVVDCADHALYFSRAPVPWDREGFTKQPRQVNSGFKHLRHIGMYAYTAGFLRRYAAWARSPLEDVECLEQLRILWHGERIRVLRVDQAPVAGVDTEEDLKRVEAVLADRAASSERGENHDPVG